VPSDQQLDQPHRFSRYCLHTTNAYLVLVIGMQLVGRDTLCAWLLSLYTTPLSISVE
jgi:hypothetical protein